MKILMISLPAIAGWGGSEELWAETAVEAATAGYTVDVVPRVDPSGNDDRMRQIAGFGARVLARAETTRSSGQRSTEVVPEEAYSLMRSADAVLLNAGGSVRELLDPAVVKLIGLAHPKHVVFTIQLVSERDLLSDYERSVAKELMAAASCVVVPAWRSHQTLERVVAARIRNVAVIPSPIKKGLGDYVEWPACSDTRLACVARLNPRQKGQDLLLEVLAEPPWPDRDWRLTFYGRGMDRAYLEDLTNHYGLQDRVIFAGQIDDIAAIWRLNHALVLTSREEGMPIVVLEALMSGRPCIVTDVGDNARYVRDGVTGFVAAGDRPAAVRGTLEAAWQRRDKWREMGLRGRRLLLRERDPSPGRTLLSHLVPRE